MSNTALVTATPTVSSTTNTVKARWSRALKQVRAVGITTRMNVMTCCRNCTVLPEGAVLWTFGGQGNAYSWFEDVMVNRADLAKARNRYYSVDLARLKRSHALEEKVYFNFTNIEAGHAAKLAFEAEGFDVDWDGTDMKCVVVNLPEVVLPSV